MQTDEEGFAAHKAVRGRGSGDVPTGRFERLSVVLEQEEERQV